MIRLSQTAIEYCKDEKQYNVIVMWSGNDPVLIGDKIRAITHINPYLALRCAEESKYDKDLMDYINSYCEKLVMGDIKSAKQMWSLFLVKAKNGELKEAFDIVSKNGHIIKPYSVVMAIELIGGDKDCNDILPVMCCALLKVSGKWFDMALDEIAKLDLHLYATKKNQVFFHSCCGYLSQRDRFSRLSVFLGESKTLERYFNLEENYVGFSKLNCTNEKDFIEMTYRMKLQSCIFLIDQYINSIIGGSTYYDSSFAPKDIVASEEEIRHLDSIVRRYEDYLKHYG